MANVQALQYSHQFITHVINTDKYCQNLLYYALLLLSVSCVIFIFRPLAIKYRMLQIKCLSMLHAFLVSTTFLLFSLLYLL